MNPPVLPSADFARTGDRRGPSRASLRRREHVAMSFGLYMIGFIILIIGLSLGAYLIHVPPRWIGVGVICMIGLGILLGVTSTRRPDPS
jgi:hypothetical protein